jgi:hypothetical protein
MKYFINYASSGFFNSQQFGLQSAESFGFKSVGYTDKDIDIDFKSKYNKILDSKRGAGYWLWKPYIILDMLSKINEGDYLVYMDSGANFIKDPSNILRMLNHKGVLTFSMVQKTSKWTKGDCFYYINDDDKLKFKDENQIQGTYIFLRKCDESVMFVKKWLDYCTSNDLITDEPNIKMDNLSDFIDHRHDQSILSLLVYNENIMYIPQVDQYCIEHGYSRDWQIINRHGIRN